MNSRCKPLRLHALAFALQGALGGLACAQTAPNSDADPAFDALVQPARIVEVGLATSSRYSASANRFNGRVDRSPYAFGAVDLRGGGTWDGADTRRWQLVGQDLGSRSASIAGEYGMQGSFRIRLGVDQLRYNASDSYQTPYLGVGTSRLTLPPNWVAPVVPRISPTTTNARGLSPEVTASNAIVGGVSTAPTAAQAAAAAALQAADLPAFREVPLGTQRQRYSLGWEQAFGEHWSWSAAVSRERKTGLKAVGGQSRAVGGDTASILPLPVDQSDNQFNAQLRHTGERWQWQLGFEESSFTNEVPSVTWALWAAPQTLATAATAPSNHFRKLLASGSWQLGAATSVVASASRSRATQNVPFLADTTALLVPAASAQAVVVAESATLKALHRVSPALGLSAGFKHDLHDNRSPVNIYGYYDNNNPANGASPFAYLYPTLGPLGANFNLNANTPYSRRVNQVNADADWRLPGGSRANVGADSQRTRRWCNGSWINCADATAATENTLRADWHGSFGDDWQAQLGVAVAARRVNYDENSFLARVPMAGQTPSTATGALAGSTAYGTLLALGLTGYGPVTGLSPAAPAGSALGFYFPLNNVLSNALYGNGNRISELIGMRRYDQADRRRQKLRAAATWQASERWELQGGVDVKDDDYTHSVYGLQRMANWALNLDAAYRASERVSLNLFASFEHQATRFAGNSYTANSTATSVNGATAIDGGCFATIALRNASNKVDPCLDWSAHSRDRTLTLGASGEWRRLMGGRLDLSGSASLSSGRTEIDVRGGSYVNNPFAGITGAATKDIAAYFIPATPLPANTVQLFDLRLAGQWRLGEQRQLKLAYGFQHLRSSDWAYEGLQDGGLTQVLPTREQAPRHSVHSIGLSFIGQF